MPLTTLVVGLGTIARTHLAVLARRDDVVVVGGVDPRAGGDHPFPVHGTVDQALVSTPEPDLVVVATPTDTHVDLVLEILGRTDALVLSEKPLARTCTSVTDLEAQHPDAAARVKVAHHFAFSPEVEWALATVAANPAWGAPSRALAVFNDAYSALPRPQLEGYVSSWVDSGPNQLSVLAGFASGWRVLSHANQTDRAVTVLAHDGGRAHLSSNWLAGDTSKQTLLEFETAGVTLRMDHTSLTAVVTRDGVITEHVGYVGTADRKSAHYLGLYDVLLNRPDDVRLSLALARQIAGVLEEADQAAAENGVRFSTITDVG